MQEHIYIPVESLGRRIAMSRKIANLTQQQLADRLCISRAAVGQWETDATTPAVDTILAVSRVIGVSPEWLAFGRVDPNFSAPVRKMVVRTVHYAAVA